MIVTYKRIDLFGRLLFETARIIPPFKTPNPMVNEACFLHIREGAYNSMSEEEILSLKSQQSVLMKCGNYVGQMLADKKTGQYRAVAVHFHPEVLRTIYKNDLPHFLIKKKKHPSRNNMTLIPASKAVDKYIDDVLFYFDNPHLANEEMLVLKIKEIILLLMQTENAAGIQTILENLFTPRTVDFQTTIESHLFHEISILELAQLTNMSLSSFKRRFKALYGIAPLQYILGKRLEKAKELLLISDLSIGDVAYSSGFSSLHHFSKKFKETYGAAPSHFRMSFVDK